MEYTNHVIDPTYFYDAIEEFSFNYKIHVLDSENTIDDYGNIVEKYKTTTIRGSLQSLGVDLNQSKQGNTENREYNFYCKSLYRINIGDIIEYKNNYLRCDKVFDDYDEYGVRAAHLKMIKLSQYRDFADYIKYINGEIIV